MYRMRETATGKTSPKEPGAAGNDSRGECYTTVLALLDAMPHAMYLLDNHGIVIGSNGRGAAQLGKTTLGLVGARLFDVLPVDVASNRLKRFQEAVTSGKPSFFRDSCSGRVFENAVLPLTDKGGRTCCIAVVEDDVTEAVQPQAYLEGILESTQNPIFACDRDYKLILANSSCRKELKTLLDVDVHIGQDVREWIPARAQSFWLGCHKRAFEGELFTLSFWYGTGDRPHFWDVTFSPIRVGARIIGVSQFVRDLTATRLAQESQQATEERLREMNERYRLIVDNIHDVIWTMDLEGQFTYVTPSIEKLRGYKVEEAMTHSIDEMNTPESARLVHGMMDLVKSGQVSIENFLPRTFESQLTHKNGGIVWTEVLVSLVCDGAGTPQGVAGVTREISERKRSEEALRQSEERFRLAMQHSAIGMALLAPDGHWLEVNQAVCNIVGYTQEELLATNFQFITHPDDLEADLVYYRKMLSSEISTYEIEKRYIHKDGHSVWIQLNASLVRDADSQPKQFIAQIQDITQRKQAEEQLRVYHDRLEDLVRMRTEELEARSLMLAEEIAERETTEKAFQAISHRLSDVRDEERRHLARELHDSVAQELAAIVMTLGLIEDGIPRKSLEIKKLVASTIALGEKCSQEVRTLSYLLHPPLLDQLGLVSAVLSYVDGFSKRSGVQIAVAVQPEFPRMPAEIELAVFRVMQECLGNVHRHSHSPTAYIRLGLEAGTVVLEVQDKGVGFPPNTLEAVQKSSPCGGVGIVGMQERLRVLGGKLKVESGMGDTIVRASIPYGGAEREASTDSNSRRS